MLSTIEFLIHEEIPKQLKKSSVLSQKLINQIMSGKHPSRFEVSKDYLSSLKRSTNERELKEAVRTCQYSIAPMLDKLIQWIPESELNRMDTIDPDDDGKYVFKHLHQLLFDLYMYIETNFSRYMDHEYSVPAYNRILFTTRTMDTLVALKSSPRFRSFDHCLQNIVLKPLVLIVEGDIHLTYRSRNYAERLAGQLLGLIKKDNDDVWQLYNRLQYIDFNSMEYVGYLTSRFSEECLPTISHKEKYIWLLERRKKIAHQLVEDGISFLPDQKPLKVMLDEWLKWEIYHVKRMIELEMTTK